MPNNIPCETCPWPEHAQRILKSARMIGVDVEEVECSQTPEERLNGRHELCYADFPGSSPEPGDRTFAFGEEWSEYNG